MASVINHYRRLAESAASAERKGQWEQASRCWNAAAFSAHSERNRVWAEDRHAFCTNAIARKWGEEYVSESV